MEYRSFSKSQHGHPLRVYKYFDTSKIVYSLKKLYTIPVTTITSKTAKAMLPPSYHPSLKPYQLQVKERINPQE